MVADAERNRDEDRRIRDLVDTRNTLESLAYQVERRLTELGDAAPEHERQRAQILVGDAREALRQEAPVDRMRSLIGELQQVAQALQALQARSGAPSGGQSGGPSAGGGAPGAGAAGDDDVVDAEFTPS
jgi:molecular chaperone DnaK